MASDVYKKIILLIEKAAELARSIGINNLLQPGLVKEMIISEILGHVLITTKRDADARDANDPSILYEYLSCKEGGSGQLDRMFKKPAEKLQNSLKRITRNHKFYYAVFYAHNQTKAKIIYELETKVVLQEAKQQLDRSKNTISHVGFSEKWVKENSKIVYVDAKNSFQ